MGTIQVSRAGIDDMYQNKEIVGANIRRAIIDKGYTYIQFAKLIGASKLAVESLCKGTIGALSFGAMIDDVCKALGVAREWLMVERGGIKVSIESELTSLELAMSKFEEAITDYCPDSLERDLAYAKLDEALAYAKESLRKGY